MSIVNDCFYHGKGAIEENNDCEESKFLTFYFEEIEYAIDIHYVSEIIGLQQFIQIPNSFDYILGIINHCGQILPLIDLSKRLINISASISTKTAIIVVSVNNLKVGLVVDSALEVFDISNESINSIDNTNEIAHTRFIRGICKEISGSKLILNIEEIISVDDLTNSINI
jgi:purine-binding chemotaxis protein CheW